MIRVVDARSLLLASAALIAIPTSAFAQDSAQPAAEPATAADTATAPAASDPTQDSATGEIIVTARRTAETLQKVPASVSAFNERSLERIQASDTTGLQGAVPNLNIVQGRGSSNATNIYIRGIGQPDALQTFDPAVGVYVDDVYYSRIRGTQLDMFDINRIEVLRGPQGTLYGKNTIGGALKVVTNRPGKTLRANGSIAVGSYDMIEAKASVSGPMTDTVSIGLSFLKSMRDGYVKDQLSGRRYNDKDTTALRGDLAFTPGDRLRLDLSADYSWDNASLTVGAPLNNLVSAYGVVLPVSNLAGNGYNFTSRTTPGFPNSTDLRHRGASATLSYDIAEGLALKSITAYRKLDTSDYIDIDATEYEMGDVLVDVDQKQFSQEFQLAYSGERFSGVAGLYYLHEKVGSHQEAYADDYFRFNIALPPLTFTRYIDDDLSTKSYAGYANGSYEVIDGLRLSAGIRFTRETKDYDRSTYINLAGVNYPPFPFSPKDSWKDVSPMASIDWQATDDVMLYARVAKGFKSGGFNGRSNSAAESSAYDPESVISYEGGFKSRIAEQLTLNGTVFQNNYKDFQARVSGIDNDPITGLPAPVLSVLNAGKLRIRGAELEAAWTPVERLLVDTQIGYLDAEYRDFDDNRFTSFGNSRAFQTPAFAPKWTIRAGAQYGFDLGGAGTITVGGQSRYKSRTALAVDNTLTNSDVEIRGLFQKGYWMHDARIVWEDADRHFSVGLYGNNLTDKIYKTDGQEFSSVGGIRTVYFGAPRTYTLRLTARY